MLNKVALDLWIYGEDENGFGVPRNAFLPQTQLMISRNYVK